MSLQQGILEYSRCDEACRRKDRKAVKVGPNREQIQVLSPKEIVERAERQRAIVARQKNSGALSGGATFVAARKLPSGDVTMVASSAAGAELRKPTRAIPEALQTGNHMT